MKYFLYWGCSLEGSGANFLVSLKPVMEELGVEWEEIKDWNCCGASISYVGANDLSIKVLNARNLAIAEASGAYDIIAPCSSCYIQMVKVNHEIQEDPELASKVNQALAEGGLKYNGGVKVRHVLDVLYHDIGVDKIREKVVKPLTGLKVGGYVGCQSVRPYGEYDSVERPITHDRIIEALGAEAVHFPKKMRCCGSGIFLPEMEYCFPLVRDILEDALSHGAQLISTVCPMCAMNLEVYQPRINKALGTDFDVPIVYLTQLMAVAFGGDLKRDAALHYNIIPPETVIRAAVE
ncbi:MAG: CoB--CoM heterodisulfide reductase iron-sulfur subunit B family protein [Deltaproteobacteria bacterium]|nr:CoB--CoM heterodisulfide reductase iron-sulfur subunit B family protein [Deltaproteobacteria bacterium]MBW1931220.1 CoB--CoM heterodisulfide reductase iron-sulfur subunit B family protein [Deltaproteobacteria bacterium]MBW2026816.1 CoB--CoM heterodisulfide reductase iron-sulfur subunit B family protein [Deltaproteobacteria bacterium]MBW2126609.1 CoB--CoM heterodisulfide reductase iron-sulfur subunit B family protein [Deltaproteobacteria bacterium]